MGWSCIISVTTPTGSASASSLNRDSLSRVAISAPIVLLVVGGLMGLLPLPGGFEVDPVDHRAVLEHLTEFTVLIALMGVGLALDRPLSLRDRSSFRRWSICA